MKTVTLCADDFAQSPAISAAILALLAAGRLSATSAMSVSPYWPDDAHALRAAARGADVGLHLAFTQPCGQPMRPLPWWIVLSQLRLLSRTRLRGHILHQVDRFADAYGSLPAFIDGHQHVHALPVLRDALFDAIAMRWPDGSRPWLRAPDLLADAGDSRCKARLLVGLCRGFSVAARAHGYAVPAWFAGLYSLRPGADFARLMTRWLAASPAGGLLMCHPGLPQDERGGRIAAVRGAEYAWLASAGFVEACRHHGVALARWTGQAA
ncbi:hypothetical protein IP92_01365 [Pseudoduganella flava]|uniref:ChbG/HpnK family deacetylase n=1 Tax=Pseudoduganella flava TaxID=871742 RepID=A0A562Q1E2_9BURK|nr:ChbG/HpnK family deacetylase [Pseudoduganella flava]QGZ38325.1 ChbG/HpnK family deacetylase [Pseudoduganella flava]TWI50136.1 hypothetical protein IP92_01365 [Pseudoduganella flava]